MKENRKLSLRKETLKELGSRELVEVAGGAIQTGIPTRCECTGFYPSLNAPCTLSVNIVCAA